MKPLVLLADPPVADTNPYMSAFPNLGLLYLASAIRKQVPGVEVRYIDAIVSWREHLTMVRQLQPRIYGLSFASPVAARSLRLIDAVKRVSPRTIIVCGGAHPTADPEDVLVNSRADICCVGEGEITMAELVMAIMRHQDLGEVPGIVFRDWNGAAVYTPRRRLVMDLDSLALPAWELVSLERYSGCRKSNAPLSTAIVASRGCPWNCAFCSNPVWRVARPWVRRRSPENIAQEVEMLYQYGVREIYIRSDEMNSDLRWGIRVFDTLADLNHSDLLFQCNLRAVPVSPELAVSMRRANCWLCHIGVESGSPRVLRGIRKGVTLQDIVHALRVVKREKITTYAFMMQYQAWESERGLEVERTGEVLRSLRLAISLKMQGLVDHISWGSATPFPGSDLWRVSQKYQLIRHGKYPREQVLPVDISLKLPRISLLEMILCRALGWLLQGVFHLTARDSYRRNALRANLRHAAFKLTYVLRPR